MQKLTKNQRGSVPVAELLMMVVAVGLAGFIGLRVYRNNHKKAPVTSNVAKAADTTPNGSVDNAVNALEQDATDEANSAAKIDSDTSQVTATNKEASDVEGSYDEKSF